MNESQAAKLERLALAMMTPDELDLQRRLGWGWKHRKPAKKRPSAASRLLEDFRPPQTMQVICSCQRPASFANFIPDNAVLAGYQTATLTIRGNWEDRARRVTEYFYGGDCRVCGKLLTGKREVSHIDILLGNVSRACQWDSVLKQR